MRLAGVLAEDHGLADRACSAGYLRSLSGPERFPIFEDRGPGSTACHIEGAGALTAAEAVRRDIARGCAPGLLSKIGKLEAGGGGLRAAFGGRIPAGPPAVDSGPPP